MDRGRDEGGGEGVEVIWESMAEGEGKGESDNETNKRSRKQRVHKWHAKAVMEERLEAWQRERGMPKTNMMEAGMLKFSKGGEEVEGREGDVINVSVSGTVWQ